MILGSHVSAAGGLHQAVARAVAVGCDYIQIFTKLGRQHDKRGSNWIGSPRELRPPNEATKLAG